jgi:hypothetical protein
MSNRRVYGVLALILLTAVPLLHAQAPLRYREFSLGSDVASVATLTGLSGSDAKVIHARPAVMKDLEWRPRYFSRGVSPRTDPVDVMVFSFYDDQLYKVTVDYERDRTAGMTEADMIEAITAEYGPPLTPRPKVRATLPDRGAADQPLAVWGDADQSVTLLRVANPPSFRLIVADARLERLARTAGAEAVRLDAREAPQREIARQKQEAEDARAAEEKAKADNKAVFRP